MKSILRVVGGLFALLLVVIGGVLVGARFADGPIAIIAGGPFTTGELVSGPEPDWSFVRDVREVEFQLLAPARSRTTWILYHEGRAYIPCGYMTTWWGKIWKRWPLEAEKDPRILLRIGDALYERELVRIQEGPSVAPLLAELSRKYAGGREIPMEAVTSGYLWLYELAPRSQRRGSLRSFAQLATFVLVTPTDALPAIVTFELPAQRGTAAPGGPGTHRDRAAHNIVDERRNHGR